MPPAAESLAQTHLAATLRALGEPHRAEIECRKALALDPQSAEAHFTLGNILNDLRRAEDAEASFRQAIACDANHAEAHNSLGLLLESQGKLRAAREAFEHAIELRPDFVSAHSNRLLNLTFDPEPTCDDVFQAHVRWGAQVTRTARARSTHRNVPDPNRPLRIGYVSPDLREHPVARFLLPVLRHHDRAQFEVTCYAEVASPDDITREMQSLAARWRSTCGLSDAALADRIEQDEIDLLIDLAGHTPDSRLRMFAHRPAPVQATYLGYPNTTGLAAIDYRLTDHWADPPQHDRWHTEQLVRLPGGFLCYEPTADAPDVAPPPALRNGYVTFGSFNRLSKVNPQVIAHWARVLHALPNARLLLKTPVLSAPKVRRQVAELFAAEGITSDRLTLVGYISGARGHLSAYEQIDIALDPLPYHGTTTTCDALWMGVPVITQIGAMHAGRVGVSLLSQVGHPEWIAANADEYCEIAVNLASNHERLAEIRAQLRPQMQSSPLCQGERFTRDLEAAYRVMWDKWCAARTSRVAPHSGVAPHFSVTSASANCK